MNYQIQKKMLPEYEKWLEEMNKAEMDRWLLTSQSWDAFKDRIHALEQKHDAEMNVLRKERQAYETQLGIDKIPFYSRDEIAVLKRVIGKIRRMKEVQ